MRKINFKADVESFQLLRDDVGIGKIFELKPEDAALLAPHIQSNLDTLYVASSGVNISGASGSLAISGQVIAIEWARLETHQKAKEPEVNVYRYLFGTAADGTCIGYEVTKSYASADNQQAIEKRII